MAQEVTFTVDGVEYYTGINEFGNPVIFRKDGQSIKVQKDIVIKALADSGYPFKSSEGSTHGFIRALKKVINGESLNPDNPLNDPIEELNKFVLDIDCLNELYEYTKDANIFNILKSDFFEIRHSNMLAWLLNPNENHGFEDRFLKKVLFEATDKADIEIMGELRPFDIELMNLSDVAVYREREHIDILLISESNKLAVAIENKVKSGEHDNQLNRYFETIQKQFVGYRYVLIYLTPDMVPPSDTEHWVAMGYDFIQKQLSNLLKICEVPDKNKIYINDYIETIRRNIVGDDKIKEICGKIYRKHKAALDLIFENIPNMRDEITERIREKLREVQKTYDFTLWQETSSKWIRFIPNKLEPLCREKGEGWGSEKHYIVSFEIENPAKGSLILKITLGPTQSEYEIYKNRMFEFAKENKDVFKIRGERAKKWICLDTFKIIDSLEDIYGEGGKDEFDSKIWKKIENYLDKKMPDKVDILLQAFEN